MLKGYKTYICAVLLGIIVVLEKLGYMSADMVGMLIPLLGAGGLASLRHSVSNG
jgi:hypothetical protein